jgi:hypothetical protein
MSSNFNCSYMARSSLTYIPFLTHLAIRPGELLPSLFVRPSTFHILIFSSETTGPIATKLWWNGPWVAPLKNCVRWSQLPTKMATKLNIEKRGMIFLKNLLWWDYWANLNQTLLKWSLGGPLPKLCPAFQTSDQAGRHSRT